MAGRRVTAELSPREKAMAARKELRQSEKAERESLIPLKIAVPPDVFEEIVSLAKEYERRLNDQAYQCLKVGVRAYRTVNTPFGFPRPIEMIDELREGEIEISPGRAIEFSRGYKDGEVRRRTIAQVTPEPLEGLKNAGLPERRPGYHVPEAEAQGSSVDNVGEDELEGDERDDEIPFDQPDEGEVEVTV